MSVTPARSRSPCRAAHKRSQIAALRIVCDYKATMTLKLADEHKINKELQENIIQSQREHIETQGRRIDAKDVYIRNLLQHTEEQENQMTSLLRDYSLMGRTLTAHGIEWP